VEVTVQKGKNAVIRGFFSNAHKPISNVNKPTNHLTYNKEVIHSQLNSLNRELRTQVSDTSRSASSICTICYKKSVLEGMGIKYGRGWEGARISLSRGSVLSREYFPSSSDILQNAPFRSQIFEIFFASGGKGALTSLTKILRTFLHSHKFTIETYRASKNRTLLSLVIVIINAGNCDTNKAESLNMKSAFRCQRVYFAACTLCLEAGRSAPPPPAKWRRL